MFDLIDINKWIYILQFLYFIGVFPPLFQMSCLVCKVCGRAQHSSPDCGCFHPSSFPVVLPKQCRSYPCSVSALGGCPSFAVQSFLFSNDRNCDKSFAMPVCSIKTACSYATLCALLTVLKRTIRGQ